MLDKDIVKNKFFYIKLLQDLKESDIEPKEYLFLENKLSKFLINEVETKYTYSKWLNIILGISLITQLSSFKIESSWSLFLLKSWSCSIILYIIIILWLKLRKMGEDRQPEKGQEESWRCLVGEFDAGADLHDEHRW